MRHAEQQIKRWMAAHTAVALVMQAAKRAAPPAGRPAQPPPLRAESACLASLSGVLSGERSPATRPLTHMSSTYMAPAGCTADRAYSSIFGSPIHTRQQIAAQLWRLLLLFQWKLAQFFVVPSSCYPIFQKCWYWRPSAKEISPDLFTELFWLRVFYIYYKQVLQNDDDTRSWMCGLF